MAIESAEREQVSARALAAPWDDLLPSALAGGLAAAAAFALGAVDVVDQRIGLLAALVLGTTVQIARRVGHAPTAIVDETERGWRVLAVELDRARRHERPLAIIRLDPPIDAGWNRAERQQELARHLRSVDRVWPDGETLYVLLPESDRVAGDATLARIRRLGPTWVGELSMAVFPDDGITTAALLFSLHGRPLPGPPIVLRSSRPPDDRYRKAG